MARGLQRRLLLATAVLSTIVAFAYAHEHHEVLTEEEMSAPVDSVLWIHMVLQVTVWGVLFPIGMVLGITRSRWHVPLQTTGFVLTTGGYLLGHSHKGRQFLPSVHGSFAKFLYLPVATQLGLGIYLKLHIQEKTVRPWAVKAHGILGKGYPILGWVQMIFGSATLLGYCRGGQLGQCLAHYIMGSGFIAYGIIMAIMLLAGEAWIKRSGRSPEWWDSWVIMLWGIVNTFTEHRGLHWSVKDMQHTTLGVLWWAGGALGVFLSRNNQRSIVPAIIVILTGWAMSEHAQELMLSTKIHGVFGSVLMLVGLARIVEICFVVQPGPGETSSSSSDSDRHSERTLALDSLPHDNPRISFVLAFRHLPPFLLVAAGFLFMSATDEELDAVHNIEMDHVTYTLIMLSIAFSSYTYVLSLIHLWANSGRNSSKSPVSGDIALELRERRVADEDDDAKWYERVPEADAEPLQTPFVIGDHEH